MRIISENILQDIKENNNQVFNKFISEKILPLPVCSILDISIPTPTEARMFSKDDLNIGVTWWLRPEDIVNGIGKKAPDVSYDGTVINTGTNITNRFAVRPLIHLKQEYPSKINSTSVNAFKEEWCKNENLLLLSGAAFTMPFNSDPYARCDWELSDIKPKLDEWLNIRINKLLKYNKYIVIGLTDDLKVSRFYSYGNKQDVENMVTKIINEDEDCLVYNQGTGKYTLID